MRKITILSLSALILAGCGGANQPVANSSTRNSSNSLFVSSRSSDNTAAPNSAPVPKAETKTKWTQSGDPIDTSSFDTEIKQAESKLKANPKDESLKKSLAAAFVARGMALTEARQYASALGDYRKALKLDPENEEAKKWIEQIIGIYESINREYPKEGEEPPPLPFKKEK